MAKADLQLQDFKYVDAWHSDANGKSSEWKRIEVSEVVKYQQEEACNFNCFATIQRFAAKKKEKGELFIAPLYFDLDDANNPAKSQADAIKLIEFFTKELDVKPADLWVYFSGSKGFHVLISSQALGIKPRNDLHKTFKHIAGYLVHRLDLTALDLVVYTSYRMLRLPNSVHQKTRLFKIELSIDELKNKTLEEIKEMAQQPRKDGPFTSEQRADGIALRKDAAHFYQDKLTEYDQAASTSSARYSKETYNFRKGHIPACVGDILAGGWKKEGDRNQATVQLACFYKDAGYTKEEALITLESWVKDHTSASSGYQVNQRVANTRSVVEAVYGKDNEYRFGCAFIRSLHGPKTPGSRDYERVACAGELCDCVKAKVDEGEIKTLHLAHTGNADFTGKLVRTKVMIAGKKHTPYIIPKKIEYSCWGADNCKKYSCPLRDIPNHTYYKDLGVQDRELIQMAGTGDDNIKGILRDVSGIPACQRYDTLVAETCNVEELLVIPMADENELSIDEEAGPDGKYVLRKVYTVGESKIKENKYYEITGYVFPHPKNQESTIIIRDAEPLQDVVDSFQLTDEIKADLAATFKPDDYTPEAINEKLLALCNDLTYNVTHIVERDETLLGVLLVLHSVLRFNVPWDKDPIRGWVEFMIVGDTATGKSALVEKILRYVGLGTRVNAESTSRTGLTYKMEQSGTGGAWYIVWGAWPLADKECIWVDEATGIKKDDWGEMTLARSDGKLEVKRAVTAETTCRVRAVLTGNVPKGKRLADYGQGVASLKDIFNNEDIRRFDAAIFMRASDVNPELYNQQLPTYPSTVSAENLKNNILYAWSRQTAEVVFMDGAIEAILETATELAKVYGNANDIPLVSPSDQRNKLARLAVALASLTHSVDESGQRVQVYPGHVEYIGVYLTGLYNSPGCGLNYYAKLSIKEEEMTDERYNKITKDLKTLDVIKQDYKFFEFIRLFAQQLYLRLGDVEAMLSIDKDEAKAIVNLLAKMRMIIMTSGGYRKTPRFNAYVTKCFELGLFDNLDDEY
jgi:hypothetical protein